ncbi:hypothetical protein D3C81_2205790 [compost metagenome]
MYWLQPEKPDMRGEPRSWMKVTVRGREFEDGCGMVRKPPPGWVHRARSQLVCARMSDAEAGW